jgi:hypothetical protein
MATVSLFKSAFRSPQDELSGRGVRPVVFDIVAPDFETSLLPDSLKMVLHVNPSSMKFSYSKIIERIQTKGGFVEQHFGDGTETISFDASTGAFMRLYTGLISITGGGMNVGGTRRETIAYDTFLDMLALFHNNGAIYDARGTIVFHGIIKILFDGMAWFGWFSSFSVSEEAENPYQFTMSAEFTIAREFMTLRSVLSRPLDTASTAALVQQELGQLQEEQQLALEIGEEESSLGWITSGS